MKKGYLYIILVLACVALYVATAFADKSELIRDAVGAKVQGFASNGREAADLTHVSQTVDMSNEIAWAVFSNRSTCKFRTMSTATKRGLTRSVPASTWTTRNIHPLAPFVNFTGCRQGELEKQ